MSNKITGNEPVTGLAAHKVPDGLSLKWRNGTPGLTIRQYYAGLALQGMLAYNHRPDAGGWEEIAKQSVIAADHLIEELNKQPIPPEQK